MEHIQLNRSPIFVAACNFYVQTPLQKIHEKFVQLGGCLDVNMNVHLHM